MSDENPTVNNPAPDAPADYQFQNKGNDGWKMFKATYNEDPSAFQSTYNDALKSKVMDKINDRRIEINSEVNDALKVAEEPPTDPAPTA